ncbi:MAG: hypothetical protein ACYSPI_08015 [Planctomycetota bacterium]|jgi:hypothetical protein
MKKCSLLHVVMVSIVLPLLLPPVFAHQPRLVGTETVVHVSLPEISKAYYGSLSGTPVTYHIEAAEPFRLYVNTLVPVMEGIEKDVSATVLKQGTVVAHLDASGHDWETFHEPFAGDDYYRGPEYVSMQDAGSYEIQVSRSKRMPCCLGSSQSSLKRARFQLTITSWEFFWAASF